MLKEYEKKRNFEQTPEPEADPFEGGEGPLRYVIQMHTATRLHWDFRLELDGVLVSWAVPKGPSLNPADKRYAIHVEDHPLSYASFEGSIPKGQYGGGEVIVWDEGIYTPDEDGKYSWDDREEAQRRMRQDLKAGKISITLRGTKLQGSFTLVKMKGKSDWLLIKHQDAHVDEKWDISKHNQSVRSGLTNDDIKEGRTEAHDNKRLRWIEGAKQKNVPKSLLPMVPTEVNKPFSGGDWAFEVKLDGIRAITIVDRGVVKILSRNGKDVTERFPMLADELARKPHESFILDGEIVIYDENGIPSFQGLMQRFQQTNPAMIRKWDLTAPVEYCVFDLLHLNGWDLREASFKDRRTQLEESLMQGPLIRVIDSFPEVGEMVYEHALKLGFEGIVAKKLESKYREGFRSSQWLKIKDYNADEFVIAGYTVGEGARSSTFGALILGKYDGETMNYMGSVGGGFSDDQLLEIRKDLDRIKSEVNPFGKKIEAKGKIQFVEPKLWAEVRYMALTQEGRLRFPVFKRLRPDLSHVSPIPMASKLGSTASSEADAVLEQLQGDRDDLKLTVEGHEIKLSSLNKIYWPAHDGNPPVTKRDLIAYYAKISEAILPHLRDRPLSLVRFPEGIKGEQFFQKHWEHKTPEFVEEIPIWSSHNERAGEYMLCNNLATLLWFGQIGTLEIHPWYSRISKEPDGRGLPTDTSTSEETLDASILNYPDFMVVDLDPYIYSGNEKKGAEPELNQKAFETTISVAFGMKQMLDDLKLKGYLKTSGKTGLHVYVPLKRTETYDVVRLLCETLGKHLMKEMPNEVTMEWVVKKRPAKVFFDHNQNVRGKTLVSIYSPRPSPHASVSWPVEWDELEKTYPTDYTIWTVPEMLAERGEKWARILADKHDIRKILNAV